MIHNSIDTSRLSPDLQELVNDLMASAMALAARVSNGGSNPPGVASKAGVTLPKASR